MIVAALALATLLPACSRKSPDEQLIVATRRNQPEEVDRLLAAGANPNADQGEEYHSANIGYDSNVDFCINCRNP